MSSTTSETTEADPLLAPFTDLEQRRIPNQGNEVYSNFVLLILL